jgi:hypothetical protein
MKNVSFILLLIFIQYSFTMKQFLRSNPEKILIVSLSKFKSSPFSLIYTKEDGSEEESPVKNIEYESLTKKLVKLHIIRLNILE